MNLIEIAEQLKDVPDQYLLQEVQRPTGNYPAYLVVSELGRRKRMRESVVKEMPQTTVAEDLTAPQRQQAMAQMAQMLQPQDQNMIPQAGGLNVLPQAQQDLAAMDMVSAQPQMPPQMPEVPAMAGGGMVSFSNGGMPNMIRTPDMEEEMNKRLSMNLGGMSARPVRKPEGYEMRGSVDMGGLRPFMDVNKDLKSSMYGMEYGRPIEGGFVRGMASYDPETRERVLEGEMRRRLNKESEISARGRYSPDSGYNFGVDYRRSFNKGGEVIRAFNGLPEDMFSGTPSDSGMGLSQVIDQDPNRFISGIGGILAPSSIYFDYMTPEEQAVYERSGVIPDSAKQKYAQAQVSKNKPTAVTPAPRSVATAPTAPAPAPSGAPSAAPADQTRPSVPPLALRQTVARPSPLTDLDIQSARTQRLSEFERAVPDTLSPLIKSQIQNREKDIAARRASNINEALMQAGLGIMASKSPRFLQAAGEGGMSGLNVFREGLKNIRQSQELNEAANIKMAEAQMLRGERKFKAADDAERSARENQRDAVALYNADSAVALRELEAQRIAQMTPEEIAVARARVAAYGREKPGKVTYPDDSQMLRAQTEAIKELGIKKYDPSNVAQRNKVEQRIAEILASRGLTYNPRITEPRQINYQED